MHRQADRRTSETQSPARAAAPAERRERAPGEKARLAPESAAASASPAAPTEDQIRKRAFEIYAAGQHPSGNAVEIWLQAERELQNR